MTVVSGSQHDSWVTLVPGEGPDPATRDGDPTFFQGKGLLDGVTAYRIRVKKDSTLGHVREIERDLRHLERTISERPPLVAKKGGAVVDEKVHDLIDEAWSLAADPAFHEDQHALTGRTLALAAALDWPGAAEEAAAVLDEVLRRTAWVRDKFSPRVVEAKTGLGRACFAKQRWRAWIKGKIAAGQGDDAGRGRGEESFFPFQLSRSAQ